MIAVLLPLFLAAENYEPRNWWGVLGLLINNAGSIFAAIASLIGAIILWRQRGVKSSVEATGKAVTHMRSDVDKQINNRKQPLRDDVDEVITGNTQVLAAVVSMGERVGRLSGDVRSLRDALGVEEQRRHDRDEEHSEQIEVIGGRLDKIERPPDPTGSV